MEKSKMYRMAQIAVLDARFAPEIKLELLRELMERESLEAFKEEREAAEDEQDTL